MSYFDFDSSLFPVSITQKNESSYPLPDETCTIDCEDIASRSLSVQEMARRARRRVIEQYGEAAFARLCLNFETRLRLIGQEGTNEDEDATDELTKQALKLLRILSQHPESEQEQTDPMIFALIWLDGRGWGQMSIKQLAFILKSLQTLNS